MKAKLIKKTYIVPSKVAGKANLAVDALPGLLVDPVG